MNDVFHYPPDLFDLLVQTIPLLNRSKKSVLLFFKGAGINEIVFEDVAQKVNDDKDNINKYEITRTLIMCTNNLIDKAL